MSVSISRSELTAWAERVLVVAGAATEPARTTAESLVEASRCGIETHGIVLLPVYADAVLDGSLDGRAAPQVIAETAAVVRLDGRNALGPAVAREAMSRSVELARESGFGVTLVSRGNHFGAGAVYVNEAARAGCIGIVMANGEAVMAPAGAQRPLLGTNPISLAAPDPRGDGALPSLDFATSLVAQGKVRGAQRRGESIPEGWAVGPDGRPTTDPEAALAGAMLPMAEHKGFGLALFVEVLTACLCAGPLGAEIPPEGPPGNTSMFFAALSLDALGLREEFRASLERLLGVVSSAPYLPGMEQPRVPGERAARTAADRAREIPLEGSIHRALDELGELVSVPLPAVSPPA